MSTSALYEEVLSLAMYTNAKAAFAYVIESDRGEGCGCPVFLMPGNADGAPRDPRELRRLQRKLGLILRQIADEQLRLAGED